MRRNIILFFLIVLLYILQSSVFSFLPLGKVTPDLMISLVVGFGFLGGSREGLWLGFICGLILDIFYGNYLGFYALLYMYIGYGSGMIRRFGYTEEIRLPLLMVACGECLINLFTWLFLFYLKGVRGFFYYLNTIILPKTVYTTLLAVFLLYGFLLLHQKLETSSKRGDREIDL